MELDAVLALSIHQKTIEEVQNTLTHMNEETESVNLEGLDILRLEIACRQKEFNKILLQEIEKLEGFLAKAQHNKSLGIQAGSPWDGKKILKDMKK